MSMLVPAAFDDDPYAVETLLEPYGFHHRLREAGPVVHLTRYDVYASGRYDEVSQILSDSSRFESKGGQGIQDIRKPGRFRTPSKLVDTDPPDHTLIRGALTKILTPIAIRRWRENFAAEAERFVERILDLREFDGVEDFCEAYVMKVFAEAVGVKLPRTETLAIGEMRFNQSGPENELHLRAIENAKPYLAWFEKARQRDSMTPGSIGEMLFVAEDKGDLPQDYASNLLLTFVGGGTDSSISGIGTVLKELAGNPDQWAIARSDPSKMKTALDEGIRVDAPFQMFFRTVARDCELSGVWLAPAMKIGVFLGAANRDPRKWTNPDKFDLNRQTAGIHLAFGIGHHICIGQMIARLEAESLLTALAKRVKKLELAGTPKYRPMNQLRTLDKLPLRVAA